MTFFNYLKSKQRFLIFYCLFHGFALFVNIFGIEGDMSKANSTAELQDYRTIHLFTTVENNSGFERDKKPSAQFWPFVPFYKSDVSYNPYENDRKLDVSKFKGIFFQYDISEFLAYSILILLILYYRWSAKKGKENSEVQVNNDSTTA